MISKNFVLSIIVPVYDEEATISATLDALLRLESSFSSMEIIVVDDGSQDKTLDKLKEFPSVNCVRHEINMGKGAAIKTGLKNAVGDIIVIQDADLEYDPSYIPYLVQPIISGEADVVYGSRFLGKPNGMSRSHHIGNAILSRVMSILYNVEISDVMTGHKAFIRKVFDSISLEEKGFSVEIELTSKVLRGGWKLTEIPISYSYRSHGKAKIRYLDGFSSLLKILSYRFRRTSRRDESEFLEINHQFRQRMESKK